MNNVQYEDVPYAVRSNFAESHSRFWQRLAQAGSWFSANQRIAIAQAARDARSCPLCELRRNALSPNSVNGDHLHNDELSDPVIEAVHAIVNDASRLTKRWYENLQQRGLSEGEYIEIVGTVVSMVSIDSFAVALGIPLRPLPTPIEGNAPSYYRPATASITDQAWVPMLDADNTSTPEADLWVSGQTGNVVRAMSLVPDEVRTLKDLSDVHYLEMPKVRQAGVDAGRALYRSQMELVAGRVSALNACYY